MSECEQSSHTAGRVSGLYVCLCQCLWTVFSFTMLRRINMFAVIPPPPPLWPFTSFPSTILSKPPEIFCSICHWGSSTSNPRCCIKYSCRFPTGWQAPLNSVQEHVADLRGWFMNIQMCNMHAGSAVSLPKSIIQSIKCNEWGSWAHILYLWDLRFTSCLVMR